MATGNIVQRLSVEEYEHLIETGALTENDRLELIRGEIIEKMPIGDPHAATVNRATTFLVPPLIGRAVVSIQNPIRLADSVPEPDVVLLRPRGDFYGTGKPRPEDVFLVIEVADSSLAFDRDVKGPLYAEAGIPEYWILDLNGECLLVHRQPRPDGTWAEVRVVQRGEGLAPLAFPDLLVTVVDLLGSG
jgi:Uma2 family endonuclease